MSQQVQELIDKIKSEGIQSAEQKAKEIEQQAQKKAGSIVMEATKQAQQIIAEAKTEILKIQKSSQTASIQASRDMLLSLRKEIQSALQKIISHQVHDTLTTENLAHILGLIVQKTLEGQNEEKDILVCLNPHDLEKLKAGFMAKLQHQLKQQVKFQSAEDIGKGFLISFDGGKSSFDFTDVALSEYLARFVNPQVASLIKEAALS
ncbi:MAG TPA: hypothetical protein DD723_00025 [Candidatus Omnitrophica bacterium]|nr:MAG: hypothetical protein A2Z81_02600 [Omnitrophica WOR_2 bacterium GWA2_45_18]OGX19513.1 MAG: hypothetical protein A2Y04_05840 [Omnitrophica WOR_2 bacterium GWC2_45_7]HBR13921.1 hypothetical protein [Candidatus Omnitrophota bacterium]